MERCFACLLSCKPVCSNDTFPCLIDWPLLQEKRREERSRTCEQAVQWRRCTKERIRAVRDSAGTPRPLCTLRAAALKSFSPCPLRVLSLSPPGRPPALRVNSIFSLSCRLPVSVPAPGTSLECVVGPKCSLAKLGEGVSPTQINDVF